jgi:hypothetical protein
MGTAQCADTPERFAASRARDFVAQLQHIAARNAHEHNMNGDREQRGKRVSI